jgi:hypothetical protein
MPLPLDLRDQTFANQTGFFRDKNSLHLDALDAWTRQRLPVFRLGCACQQEKCIHEICDWRATRMLVDTDGILGRHRDGSRHAASKIATARTPCT